MPYSDNLYSIDSDDEYLDIEPIAGHDGNTGPSPRQEQPLGSQTVGWQDEEDLDHALSPADGNFPSADTNPSSAGTQRAWSHIPHVPNILVADPSLEQGATAESKAREARQERLDAAHDDDLDSAVGHNSAISSDHGRSLSRVTSPHSSSAYTPTPSTSSRATHYQPSTAGAYSAAYTPSATSRSTSHGPRRSIYTPSSPFLPREAPPAYTPSPTTPSAYTGTTSPTSPTASSDGRSNFSRNYQTFSQRSMEQTEESRGLLANPESMGNLAHDDFGDVTPAWRDRVRRRLPYLNWRNCRYAAVCLALLLITVGFIVSAVTSIKDEHKSKGPTTPDPPTREPVLDPPAADPPHMDYPSYDGDLPWYDISQCSSKLAERETFDFSVNYGRGHSFSLVQDVAEHNSASDYHPVSVYGDFIVRRVGQGTPGPSVVVELVKNAAGLDVTVAWDRAGQALRLTVPRRLPDEAVSRPCVALRATLWVPADAELASLTAETVHLGIRLLDNLAVRIAEHASLASVVGPITAAADGTDPDTDSDRQLLDYDAPPPYFRFEARVIEVKATAGRISGYWPLYDHLGLTNAAGSTRVRVRPHDADPAANPAAPAVLYIKSLSGTIEVWEPVDQAAASSSSSSSARQQQQQQQQHDPIPPRDYRADLQSTSGNIRGAVAFGSAARVHTTSGTAKLAFLPVLDAAAADVAGAAVLETSTTSGTAEVRVLEPLWYGTSASGGESGAYYLPPPPADGETAPPPVVVPIGRVGGRDPYEVIRGPQPRRAEPAPAPRALRCLQSRHASTSAALRVAYPASWEGGLELSSLSGGLRAWGEGLEIVQDGTGWPVGRKLVASKGEGGGSALVGKSTSGGVRVFVGEEE